MIGQLCWLLDSEAGERNVLHLRLSPNEPWKPYTAFPQFSTPDYQIPSGSKGWATYQKLLKAGWKLVPTHQAQHQARQVILTV